VALREAFWVTFDPKVRDRLKRHEQARNLGRMARAINGKLDSLQVKVVEHEGSLYDTKERIEDVLLPVNKAKVHSSENTDFLMSPLVEEFGYQGNEQTENAVLQGTYVPPPSASRCSKLFLKHCVAPPGLPISDDRVSTADHCKGWKRAKERTSGGRSRIIFAMCKAEATDPVLAALDAWQSQNDKSPQRPFYHVTYPLEWWESSPIVPSCSPLHELVVTECLVQLGILSTDNKKTDLYEFHSQRTANSVKNFDFRVINKLTN